MGCAVYLENQVHKREYAGSEVSEKFSLILAESGEGGLLRYVDPYGDTIFNVPQLYDLIEEVNDISAASPEVREAANLVIEVIWRVIRRRGYLAILGD
ncbi:hypothetical protein GCM10027160_33260 [Streptomyces calidiresistens]|uniref:Uncharacterized protein n=1 Tax=Streptomyces calidiresistens TaxID=1485586 RepID=A0A7W3XXI0_9ACTN|nr:hypothetical protein [Streptomyces calidiresistens]MBB0230842.1 hypothetical protein [Streptomyces calidiresistens]